MAVGVVCAWGHLGSCWWGASEQPEGTGVGHEATPGGLWGGWEVSIEGSLWSGRYVRCVVHRRWMAG